MRILITGGAGFIGTNIAQLARAKGHKPYIFDSFVRNNTEENIIDGVTYIRGDIRNYEDFQRILPELDGIIHLAGQCGVPWSMSWPLYDFNVNALGSLNVLEYARSHDNIPVILASTNKVYHDGINEIPMREEETRFVWENYEGVPETFPIDSQGKHPKSPYGVSKTTADLYFQEYYHMYKTPTVVNRMSCIYGYHQKGVEDQGWISHFVKTIEEGDGQINIYGNGKQVRDMLWGTDVASLYLDELEHIDLYKGQVFNVGGGKDNTLSLLEAIKEIESNTINRAKLTFLDERPADQRIYISDITKVTSIHGWKPRTSPHDGIQLMMEDL